MTIIYPQVKSKSIPVGHLPASKLLLECGMDKFEIRRQNLLALIESRCDGRAVNLAARTGIDPSYISRMLYPAGKKSKKAIGEEIRDRIEDAFLLKRGSLDEELGGVGDPAKIAPPAKEPVTSEAARSLTETTLERLDLSEKTILELYRSATNKGKIMIKDAASRAPKGDN